MEILSDCIGRLNLESIGSIADAIISAYESDSAIYIFGNGGSGATASHIVCDFNKGVSIHLQKKFRFVCLNDNMTSVLAISNDCGYDKIFRMQLEGRLKPGDLVIGISGSGNSKNVLSAIDYAKEAGNITIGFSGYDGGDLLKMADLNMFVDLRDMQKVEDIHMMILHVIAQSISVKLGHPMC